MPLLVERWYPISSGVLASVVCLALFMHGAKISPKTATALLPVVVNVSSIAIGFLATALAILLSMDDRPIIRELRNAKSYGQLVNYLVRAIQVAFLLAILSAGSVIIDLERQSNMIQIVSATWVAIATATVMSCYRVIHLLSKILRERG